MFEHTFTNGNTFKSSNEMPDYCVLAHSNGASNPLIPHVSFIVDITVDDLTRRDVARIIAYGERALLGGSLCTSRCATRTATCSGSGSPVMSRLGGRS